MMKTYANDNLQRQTFRNITPREVDEIVHRARQMQAEVVADLLRRAGRAVARAVRVSARFLDHAVIGPLGGRHRETRHYLEPLSLDDRMLADIGVTRDSVWEAIYTGRFRRRAWRPVALELQRGAGAEPEQPQPAAPAEPKKAA